MYVFMLEKATMYRPVLRGVLCALLSVLVHGVLVWLLLWALPYTGGGGAGRRMAQQPPAQRVLHIITPPQEEQKPQFVKTSPDQEEQLPRHADFIGKRSSVESAAEFTPARRSDAPLPSQNGEDRDEIVTFNQRRQEGDLAHDDRAPTPPPAPSGGMQQPDRLDDFEDDAPERVHPDDTLAGGVASVQPQQPDQQGDMVLHQADKDLVPTPRPTPPVRVPTVARQRVTMQGMPTVYDPSLADHMQPQKAGFRTRERSTRSTGRFVIGQRAALNVAATPQGRYEEEIYRRIAYFWYIACDEHRGDIIPGSIVIALRINSRGLLENMDLVRRTGASISQQGFTFGAIRRAALPPMPPAVRQEMVGDLLELIFQFNFD